MYNIKDYSQREIEAHTSMDEQREQLKLELDLFLEGVGNEPDEALRKEFPDITQEQIDDIVLQATFAMFAVQEYQMVMYDRQGFHNVEPSDAIFKLIKTRIVETLAESDEHQKRVEISAKILKALTGIFYDISYKAIKFEQGFRNVPVYKVPIAFIPNPELVASWQYYVLPLKEKPLNWKTNVSGGYHTIDNPPILNRGNYHQPDNVLDVLNTLQSNRYTLHPETCEEDYYRYKLINAVKKTVEIDKRKIVWKMSTAQLQKDKELVRRVRNTLVSFDKTVKAVEGNELYFEWRFDFRGRMYETGYNVKNQGDKYQKGMLIPVLD